MKWISVKDKLPETIDKGYVNNVRILVCWGKEKENVAEAKFEKVIIRGKSVSRFIWNDRILPWKATHWMPLPEPPKED